MANKINEVWYSYNAKGKKIPPYKSATAPKRKGLISRMWHTYKANWIEITGIAIFAPVIIFGIMYVMIHALAAIMY
tara:strand:+ start:213 stop:440 length:228 start_codon:yes stop_codon:yes gene_type:complete